MSRNADHERDADASIAVPVPVSDPRLFGNKAVDDLLSFLARNRGERFGVRELADEIGHSRSTVSRAVDVLADNGLLEEKRGVRRLVGLDPERVSVPDDPVLEVPQPAFRPPLRAAVDALTTELEGLVALVVHGPVARGTAAPDDTIRLCALVDGAGDPARQRERAEAVAADLRRRRFDGTRYAVEVGVENVAAAAAAELRDVLLDGIVIHRTDGFETVRERARSASTDD